MNEKETKIVADQLRRLANAFEANPTLLHSVAFSTCEDLYPDIGHADDKKRPVLKALTLKFLV